jgi:hypothetical protein
LVEVNTSLAFVATQSETEGHDTAVRVPPLEGTDVLVQELAPPVGSVDVRMVRTVGPPPPATQSDADGHEITPRLGYPPIVAVVQALAPPLGSVVVSTSLQPATTHSEIDGHETPPIDGNNPPALSQARRLFVGVVELRMLAASSPATHSDADGQEMATIPGGVGLTVSRQAANPLELSTKESSAETGDRMLESDETVARGMDLPLLRSWSTSYSNTSGGLPESAWSAAKRPASLTAVTGPQ